MTKKGRQTPLYAEHLASGAKMINFHGWLMPLSYRGVSEEVKSVRKKAGLFDLSHMGEIKVGGKEASSFLQFVTTNDLSRLAPGQMQYSFFLSSEGTVLDDFMLYRLAGDEFMAVVNAGNTEKIFKHLQRQRFDKVELANLTENLALIGLQGPNSEKIFREVVEEDLDGFKFLHSKEFRVAGEKALVSRSGYTGEDGFEVYLDENKAPKVWRAIMDAGRPLGLEPAGLGARDILRCEMGYPLYGHEWDETITPWEAGFSWAVKLNKNFLGKEALLEKKGRISQTLAAFVMKEKAVPRTGYLIKDDPSTRTSAELSRKPSGRERKNIGRVTSGTFSPIRGDFIGMGYILKDFARPGEIISIEIRGKLMPAEIVRLPFVKPHLRK
ncbi:MAG: glycine cleavage system aminomethyltransferase GcvT [Candidatus Ratteibacteria bacterium]|nr:glycine cleavage system aminomethyltransferase GcvT [Candidatus Ratteibacteria bacterium]